MAGNGSDGARLSSWFLGELAGHLPPWLVQQRWFGGKARVIEDVSVQDVLWLPATARPVAVVVADVVYASSGPDRQDRCALVLGVEAAPTHAAIARMPNGEYVTDQSADGDAVLALLAGLLDGTDVAGVKGGSLVYADSTHAARLALGAVTPSAVRPVGVEQSNTSVKVGATHVFKLFRRLEAGEHPQLEIGRFFAVAGCAAVPALEGSLTYRAADGRESALGALEPWVSNEGDGWTHVLARLGACRRDPDVRAELYIDLVALGETTAAFHDALGGPTCLPAFVPEAVTTDDVAQWHHDVKAQAERTVALLVARRATLTPEAARLADAVIAMPPDLARTLAPSGTAAAFDRIRIHGDFHLGQTLKRTGGFVIIDFEGEPGKPLAARRRKQCALRDVAGMLRSLDYAAATADRAAGADAGDAAPRAGLRQAFLESYFSRADRGGARYLPAGATARQAWTSLFELEKALYEVEYELNNRPAWVHIPLAGLSRLLGRDRPGTIAGTGPV